MVRNQDLHVKWQAVLQLDQEGLKICWRMHDAYHCLRVEDARELRDVLNDLLRDAEFAERYQVGSLTR